MFFKIKPFVIFISVLSLLGCNLETGDWVSPEDRGRLSTNCISELEKNVNLYIEGEQSQAGVVKTMNCVRKTLKEFGFIAKKENGGFLPEKLSSFLNRKFLGESKITPELLAELMEIKTVVVGGRKDFVTMAEFKKLRELTYVFQEAAVRTAPHIKVYRNKLDVSKYSSKDLSKKIKKAKNELNQAAIHIGEILKNSAGLYKVESVKKLIKHSRIFFNWDEKNPNSLSVDDQAELFAVYKLFAVGESRHLGEEVITRNQWIPIFSLFSGILGLQLDYKYKLKDKDVFKGQALEDLIESISGNIGALKIIETALWNRLIEHKLTNEESPLAAKGLDINDLDPANPVIKFSTLERILLSAQKLGFIPKNFRVKLATIPALEYVVQKVFRKLSVELETATSNGIGYSHLEEISSEFNVWADGQKYISNKYIDKKNPGADMTNAGVKDVVETLENIKPFYLPEDNTLWVLHPELKKKRYKDMFEHNFDSLTRLNVIKTFARFLIRGFAKDSLRAQKMQGITEDEAIDFSREAKLLGEDLEYMDKRNSNIGARFFTEANLFTFSSDGLDFPLTTGSGSLLSFKEAIEQMAFIYSGSKVRDKMYDDAIEEFIPYTKDEKGEISYGKDVKFDLNYGKPLLPMNKFIDRLTNESYKKMTNLPSMVSYLDDLSEDNRRSFFESLIGISHHFCAPADMVEYGEIATLTTLSHYIEVIFSEYDKDFNGMLDEFEVMHAYTKFRGFMIPIIIRENDNKPLEEEFYKATYAFLLMEGRRPDKVAKWRVIFDWGKNDHDASVIYRWTKHFNNDPNEFRDIYNKNYSCVPEKKDDCGAPPMNISRTDLLGVLQMLMESTDSPNCSAD